MTDNHGAAFITNETYLGDGVYASFDGYQIWLRTEDFTTNGILNHHIALESDVFAQLIEYEKNLRKGPQQC